MIRQVLLMFTLLFTGVVCAEDFVTTVTARQVQPWNGFVEITVGLSCESNDLAEVFCTFAATNGVTRTALPVSHVRQVGYDTGSGMEWRRRFIWDVAADLGEVKISDVALTVDAQGPVQLWDNGPYWAPCNIGATRSEEVGCYFWWGDTIGYMYNGNAWVSIDGKNTMWNFNQDSCPTCGMSSDQLQSKGYIDSTGNLATQHDVATVRLGVPWRMPTGEEFATLISNCTTTWTTHNGVAGYLVTGKGDYASKSIFLPASGGGMGSTYSLLGTYGTYWSSTPRKNRSDSAYYIEFTSDYFEQHDFDRYCARCVRPVRGSAP